MERLTLYDEFENNSARLKETQDSADRVLYLQIIDNILDEWNLGKTVPFVVDQEYDGA